MFHLILNFYNKLPFKNILNPIKNNFLFNFCREFVLKGVKRESMVKIETSKIRAFLKLIRPIQSQFSLIRIGCNNDGGYLIPDDLAGIKYSFSPGVGNQISFDLDLAKRGIQSFLADGSIDRLPAKHQLISFEKVYIGIHNTHGSKTLDYWISSKAPHEKDFILQMDIEGAEYKILKKLSSKRLRSFRIMVIEFHDLERLIYRHGFKSIHAVFKKITKFFDVVHIHPNNSIPLIVYNSIKIPPVLEFTFLRKDRVKSRQFVMQLPHKLDQKNNLDRRDISLPPDFYK